MYNNAVELNLKTINTENISLTKLCIYSYLTLKKYRLMRATHFVFTVLFLHYAGYIVRKLTVSEATNWVKLI